MKLWAKLFFAAAVAEMLSVVAVCYNYGVTSIVLSFACIVLLGSAVYQGSK